MMKGQSAKSIPAKNPEKPRNRTRRFSRAVKRLRSSVRAKGCSQACDRPLSGPRVESSSQKSTVTLNREPRVEHGCWRKPGGAIGDRIVGLVERGSGVAVEQVVQIDGDVGSGTTELQDL